MWILLLLNIVSTNQISHKYSEDEEVILWFNKLVPFDNPQETYAYSYLPLCVGPRREKTYILGLIEGYELEDSSIDMRFIRETKGKPFCTLVFNQETKDQIATAIKRKFWLQMYIDDLPLWSAIGEYDEINDVPYIYTHYSFFLSYNNNEIILAKTQFERPVNINSIESTQFYYSISWTTTDKPFTERFNSYLDPGFFENNIHWFSIINSFVMVILLCALVLVLLYRTISNDYERYNIQEIEANDFVEAKGWKQVAGEVFKAPDFLPLFTTGVCTGYHLAYVILIGIISSLLHPMYTERGSSSYYLLIEYALLGIISGFQCGSIYTQYKGKRLFGTALLASIAFPGIICSISMILNLIAWIYSSSASIPLISIIQIAALLLFVYLPLFLSGLLIGRRYQLKRPSNSRINSIKSPLLLVFIGGLLPFSSIYVEVYYVFSSFWNYKFYYVYGFALISFLLFILSVACVAIVATYSTLNSEDYRWHWISFLSPASSGFYLFVYSIFYYFCKSKMSGYFQFTFYFSYMFIGSASLGLLAGSLGYTASYYFVKKIYSNMKFE